MIKLFITLNDSAQSFSITAKKGKAVLKTVKGHYHRDLDDKIISGLARSISSVQVPSSQSVEGLDKILPYVKIKKRDNFRVYYDSQSRSFVSNLIVNSVVDVFNWFGQKSRNRSGHITLL